METMISSAPNQYEMMLNHYASILEKTNQQLSVWSNPYGVMIGILTLLVAIGAIVIAIILWWNSKDQRDRAEKFFTEQEKIIRAKNASVKTVELKLGKLIQEYEAQLKSATRDRRKIQNIIDDLKKEQAGLGARIGPSSVFATSAISSSNYLSAMSVVRGMICSSCGRSFEYFEQDGSIASSVSSSIILGRKEVYCIYCGAKNIPQ